MRSKRFLPRSAAFLLAVLLLLPLLAACGSKRETAGGAPSLTVDKEGKMTFSLRLNAEEMQAHTGQTAYLYELKPGETVYDINKKSAMLQNNVSSKLRFSFPMRGENGEDRRCNTYLLTFSDGTVVEADLDSGEFSIKYPDGRVVSGKD